MARTPRSRSTQLSDDESQTGLSSGSLPGMTDPESAEFALSPEDQVDIDRINEVLKMNDLEGGKVRLSRKGPEDTQFQYLCTLPIAQFDIEWIKRVHGGGDYKGSTFRSNGQKGKPIPSFSIDYKAKGSTEAASTAPRTVSYTDPIKQAREIAEMVTSGNKGTEQMNVLREMMAQSRNDQQSMMQLMVTQMTESSKSQMAMMTETMRSISSAQAARSTSSMSPEIWAAIIAGVSPVVVKLLERPQSKEGASMLESIELIKAVKETFADNEKEDSVLGSFFKAIGPALGAMTGVNGQGQGQPRPQLRPPQALPAPGQPQRHPQHQPQPHGYDPRLPSPVPSAAPSQDHGMISTYITMLHDAAANNADPAPYADMLFNHAPPQFIERLTTTLQQDDWMTQLFADDPRASSHAEWLGELREIILSANSPEQNDQPTQQPAAQPASGSEHPQSTGGGTVGESGIPDDAFGHGVPHS